MELRDFLDIFVQGRKLFLSVVVGCVVVGAIWYGFQPLTYRADLTLNVARSGVQQTADYRYDGFYRLQADERFADTVVRWLGSPRIVDDIGTSAGSFPLPSGNFSFGGVFDAKRLSSQVIDVTYRTSGRDGADRIAQTLIAVLNRETARLNTGAAEQSWFVVQGERPVIVDGRQGLVLVLIVSLALGTFLGFWSVLFHRYFRPVKNGKQ